MMYIGQEMKLLRCLFFVFILLVKVMVHAQPGFISIDCGIVLGSNYTSERGILYNSDEGFTDSGVAKSVLPVYDIDSLGYRLKTLTSFPQNPRNCYTLRPKQGKGNKYLIRARFLYGNYDLKSQLPQFDLHIGSDYWDTIIISSLSEEVHKEIMYISSSDSINVCLINTGKGTPFISAIELRLLDIDMYQETKLGGLNLVMRINYGENLIVRYEDDKYDRIWSPYTGNYIPVYTYNQVIPDSSVEEIPSKVMRTAITLNDSFSISWEPVNPGDQFIIYMHFAELQVLDTNQTRAFNIYLNGDLWYGPLSPVSNKTTTIRSSSPLNVSPKYEITINKTENSTLCPIINAFELFTVKQLRQMQTEDQDASAIWSIKSTYGVIRNWQGDPCVPQPFVWEGLECTYIDTRSPRIISLNLSSSGLNKELAADLVNLTMLRFLDMSNNSLTGNVPDFLSQLAFLMALNLTGNKFTGSVPTELLEKSKKGSLLLSVDGISSSNITNSCGTCEDNKNKKIVRTVVATVTSLFVILTAFAIIWMIKRKKSLVTRKLGAESKNRDGLLEFQKQQFTLSEVLSITDNFNVIIGKGAFGTVYHGNIGDKQVAVKMLSPSSNQGHKEFKAEVNLLMSVRHGNLTSLVGYCNEGIHMGIIYEFMANGSLETHLFDATPNVLSWEARLQIGCDVAHGLEYLHYGCNPPIVHRDVKCSNILLNEKLQAKLSDFGLSKAFSIEGGSHMSTRVAGTPGYLDPEYCTSNRLTEKSDVYSFGVVLLNIITGQPAIDKHDRGKAPINQWVNLTLAVGDVKEIVDPRLQGDFDVNSAWKAVELAMNCVAHTGSERPTMKEVVIDLNGCLTIERARQDSKPKDLYGVMSLNLESAHLPDPR